MNTHDSGPFAERDLAKPADQSVGLDGLSTSSGEGEASSAVTRSIKAELSEWKAESELFFRGVEQKLDRLLHDLGAIEDVEPLVAATDESTTDRVAPVQVAANAHSNVDGEQISDLKAQIAHKLNRLEKPAQESSHPDAQTGDDR